MTRIELVSHINDVLARGLSPERTLTMLHRRANGADDRDLLTAGLMLLCDQQKVITELKADVDRLEDDVADLMSTLIRKSTT